MNRSTRKSESRVWNIARGSKGMCQISGGNILTSTEKLGTFVCIMLPTTDLTTRNIGFYTPIFRTCATILISRSITTQVWTLATSKRRPMLSGLPMSTSGTGRVIIAIGLPTTMKWIRFDGDPWWAMKAIEGVEPSMVRSIRSNYSAWFNKSRNARKRERTMWVFVKPAN